MIFTQWPVVLVFSVLMNFQTSLSYEPENIKPMWLALKIKAKIKFHRSRAG